jgi:hypothetical protein
LIFFLVATCENNSSEKCWVPVAHTCNPSYSEGRDQEDHGLKPAEANSSQDPILEKKKNPTQNRAGGVT